MFFAFQSEAAHFTTLFINSAPFFYRYLRIHYLFKESKIKVQQMNQKAPKSSALERNRELKFNCHQKLGKGHKQFTCNVYLQWNSEIYFGLYLFFLLQVPVVFSTSKFNCSSAEDIKIWPKWPRWTTIPKHTESSCGWRKVTICSGG